MAPFWLPDIFIAQSFMWDIAKLFEAEKPVGGNQTEDMHAEADSALQSSSDLESVSAFLSAWHAGVRAEILNPLSALLSNTSARLFARTIPLKPITANSTYHGVLLEHSMNRALRGIKKGMWRRKGWGIMDWEERVRGLEVYEDASLDRAHPNVVAGRVFWQMVLADLYQRTE
ncbi:hypothetical protein BC830DRAFT_1122669 [Chytriomyces sp. MP71]|nr:hypothetical protein BC830DRAFT_1122669 [Chytriomyces sp. MP71]